MIQTSQGRINKDGNAGNQRNGGGQDGAFHYYFSLGVRTWPVYFHLVTYASIDPSQ